jgi:recombination protein RecR
MKRQAGPEIERLIQLLARLPGLGPRSARRAVLHLIKNREKLLDPLTLALEDARLKVTTCSQCGNVDTLDPCSVCIDPRRDRSLICVVEEVGDVWALERANAWGGLYHVLGGTLSALGGVTPEDLSIGQLIDRASDGVVKEIVLATNATVEGQTTAPCHVSPRPWRACGRRVGLSRRRHVNPSHSGPPPVLKQAVNVSITTPANGRAPSR